MMRIFHRNYTRTQIIAIGFFLIIIAGSLLLMLPISTRSGESVGFIDSLFTATSATCVTGLVVVDTSTNWSIFGQIVILLLIQVGGLGFITIGILFAMFFRRKIGLNERELIQESVSANKLAGVVKLVRSIIFGTLIFEGVGALLLCIRFVPRFGIAKGIYFSVFHSVSAFCNAGFDIMGFIEPYTSFTTMYDDVLVNFTIMALIIIGGLGFVVWQDVAKHKWHYKKYNLHTKLVLVTTTVLVFGGALLFYLFEADGLFKGMSVKGTICSSLFSSVTARTAGFNTVDTASLSGASGLLTVFLMFIGGSPGSTAGGIKTTTFAVMLIYIWNSVRGNRSCNIFGRRIGDDVVQKAAMVFCINLVLALTAALAICGMQKLPITDVVFEVFSAIGTVGMSTGVTRDLSNISRLIIILLMYCGRIGSLSFALAFTEKRKQVRLTMPEEKINVG